MKAETCYKVIKVALKTTKWQPKSSQIKVFDSYIFLSIQHKIDRSFTILFIPPPEALEFDTILIFSQN